MLGKIYPKSFSGLIGILVTETFYFDLKYKFVEVFIINKYKKGC